jgi:hypothetical protein
MRSVRLTFGCLIAFCAITFVGFPSVLAAQPRAQEGVQPNRAHIMDIELADGGILSGALVDSNGAAVAGSEVSIRHQGSSVATVETDERGQFQVCALRGGVYEIRTDHGGGIVRAWAPQTAPPSALEGIVLVARRNVVRGQQPRSPYSPPTNDYDPIPNSYTPASTYGRTARNSAFPAGNSDSTVSNANPPAGSSWLAPSTSNPTTGAYGGGLSNTSPPGDYGPIASRSAPSAGSYGVTSSNTSPLTGPSAPFSSNPGPSPTDLYGPQSQYNAAPNVVGSTRVTFTQSPGAYDLSPPFVDENGTGFRGFLHSRGPLILDLVNLGLGITGTTLGAIAILDDDDAS